MNHEKQYPAEEFFLKKVNLDRVFSMIDRTEYMFLYYIRYMEEQETEIDGVYLADLAKEMGFTIPEMSRTVERLQDKSYIYWKTDVEKGRTYVQLTEVAVNAMEQQKEQLTRYYERIQKEIDPDDLKITVATIYKISQIAKRMEKNS